MKETDRLLTFDEAARRLGLKRDTVRLWAAARRLTKVKLGRCVRLLQSEVEQLIERNVIPRLPERDKVAEKA